MQRTAAAAVLLSPWVETEGEKERGYHDTTKMKFPTAEKLLTQFARLSV